jgi:hypothetical protein
MDTIGRLDPASHPWEKKENPQTYDILPSYGENPRPSQHTLGLVGGNNAPYKNRQIQVDTESDLRGITRANTFCPGRQHKPLPSNTTQITRDTPKQKVTIPVYTQPLKQSQFWAYPATLAPEPLTIETCGRPEKY